MIDDRDWPGWTRTPPTKSGRYWFRFPDPDGAVRFAFRVIGVTAIDGMGVIVDDDYNTPVEALDGEWWPRPIQPPVPLGPVDNRRSFVRDAIAKGLAVLIREREIMYQSERDAHDGHVADPSARAALAEFDEAIGELETARGAL